MKKTKIILSILAAALLFGSCTINKPKEETRKVTVTGSGTINVDQTILTFTVKSSDYDQNPAVEKNTSISSKLQEDLKEAGIDPKDLYVSGNEIAQEKVAGPWVKNDEGVWVQKDTQYNITNTIKATIRDVTKTKAIKEAVLAKNKEGVILSSIQYVTNDINSSLRQARTLAIQNAQDSANLLAGASSCKTDKVLEIVEGETIVKNVSAKSILSETLPGSITAVTDGVAYVTANVTLTYTLIN